MKLQNLFKKYETLSLRKLAGATGVNYNMLLKAAKRPVEGEIYNPDKINWVAIEKYLNEKATTELEGINWEEVASADVQVRIADIEDFVVGTEVRLRNDETVYQVVFVSKQSAQIVIYDEVANVTRLFKAATFLHQGPKVLPVVEEAAEKATIQELLEDREG